MEIRMKLMPEGAGRIDEDFKRAKQALYNAIEPNEIVFILHTKFGISIRLMKIATRVQYRVAKQWVTHNVPPGSNEADVLKNLKAIVLFLAESGMLYQEEIARFLNSRRAEVGYARPITILRNADLNQITGVSARLVARLRGFDDDEEIAI